MKKDQFQLVKVINNKMKVIDNKMKVINNKPKVSNTTTQLTLVWYSLMSFFALWYFFSSAVTSPCNRFSSSM